MAIADWLNPATPQPTYLTSRAAGVVVPEFYRAASETRKNALSLAGQEQGLLINEEQNLRARDAEARRKAEEAAAAAFMPRLTQLDPTKPDYFTNLSRIMAEPGAANFLATQQARSFLDLAGGARSEQIRASEQSERDRLNREEEDRRRQDQIDSEARESSRRSLEGAQSLLRSYAESLGDDDFAQPFTEELNKISAAQKDRPSEVPTMLSTLTEKMTRERNQRAIKNDLINSGVKVTELDKFKDKNGRFGDKAREEVSARKQRLSSYQILTSQLRMIDDDIEATPSQTEKERLREMRRNLFNQLQSTGRLTETDVGSKYVRPVAGGKPSATGSGDSKVL